MNNIAVEAQVWKYALIYAAVDLEEVVIWADNLIVDLEKPPIALFDISSAKSTDLTISALDSLEKSNDTRMVAKRIFYFFHRHLKVEDPDYELISQGIYDMALAGLLPSPQLESEMFHYSDALNLAELGISGNILDIKANIEKLLYDNMEIH